MSYDRRMTEAESNATPHQPLRVPKRMWQAFGRVCSRRGTSRNARIVEMIRAEIRHHGDRQDKADLEAADAELRERRSRKGIRHRHRRRPTGDQGATGRPPNSPSRLLNHPDSRDGATGPQAGEPGIGREAVDADGKS
jgi:hypothetical protein